MMTDSTPQTAPSEAVNTSTNQNDPAVNTSQETNKPSKAIVFLIVAVVGVILLVLCIILSAVAIIAINPAGNMSVTPTIDENTVLPTTDEIITSDSVYYQKIDDSGDYESYSKIFKLDLTTKIENEVVMTGALISVSSDGKYFVYSTEDPESTYGEPSGYYLFNSATQTSTLLFTHIPGTQVTSSTWAAADDEVAFSVSCYAPRGDGEYTGKTCKDLSQEGELGIYVATLGEAENDQSYSPKIVSFPYENELVEEENLDIDGHILGWNKEIIYVVDGNLEDAYEINLSTEVGKVMPWRNSGEKILFTNNLFSSDFQKIIYSQLVSEEIVEVKTQAIEGGDEKILKSGEFASVQELFFVPGSTTDYYYFASDLLSDGIRQQTLMLVNDAKESEIASANLMDLYRMGDSYLVINQSDALNTNNLLLLNLASSEITTLTSGTLKYGATGTNF